ncbi:MAG: ribonuclease R [Alphaproteobacteria bacterium]|nr:ribonuclease R [Alphaproteobacteria bacterium]
MKRPPKRAPKTKARNADGLPSKDDVLNFLAEHPGEAGKREIARAFNIKGAARIALKVMLKELEGEGAIQRGRGKRLTRSGDLSEIMVLAIADIDTDGELLARPVEWQGEDPPPRIVVAPERDKAESLPAMGIGDRILAHIEKLEDGTLEARLIRRLGQSAHHVLGVLARVGNSLRVRPVDRKSRIELIVERGDENGAREGDLVLAAPLPGRALGLPRATVKECLGNLESPGVISLIAIHAHGIPDRFPSAVLAEAQAAKPARHEGREDLRALPLITIDPIDARDHDDAVYAERDDDPRNPGGVIVYVAIADVSYYVTPGSALDREALRRGVSAYFPDRVEPMLPEALSNELCSLKEGLDRPCLAVRMTFDAKGKKRHHKFVRGTMRSAAKLSYQQVQAARDGRSDAATKPILERVLDPLWRAYEILARARDARGPLEIDVPEHKIELGSDGQVQSIRFRERLESMRLIEEFMIQANVAAAEALEHRTMPLIFRVHDQPTREKLESLSKVLDASGISFAKGQVLKPAAFNRILAQAAKTPHAAMINEVVLRTQAQAEYTPDNIGHFGLNLRRYAHFTSPIRRYADLIVHRALIRAFDLGEDGLRDSEIERLGSIASEVSSHERRAMSAERDAKDRYIAAFMQDRIGAEFEGRISGVTRFGLFVRLSETGADGLVPVRSLGGEYFHHDENLHALIGERSRLTYRLGETVRVKLAEAAPITGGLRFDLVEGGSKSASRPAGARKGKPARKLRR